MEHHPPARIHPSAITALARRLHAKLEHLDPSDDTAWEELEERERLLYQLCIKAVLDDRTLVLRALEERRGNHPQPE